MGKFIPVQRALLVLALAVCFSAWARPQTEGEKSASSGHQESSQESSAQQADSFPEGEPLPDMPEPRSDTPTLPFGQPGNSSAPSVPDYTIGAEDVLEIEVFNVPELKRTARVSNDGTINLALIGRVKASGFTVDQLQAAIEKKYGETYLQDPQVSVFITEFKGQSVSVIGAVDRPGIYQLTAPRKLIDILSMAGGLSRGVAGSAGRTLIVSRASSFADVPQTEGVRLIADNKLEIEIPKLLYSEHSELNIPITPNDTISVSRADLVYVVGDVKKPTGIALDDRDEITVLQAVAVAEGLNRTASKNKARIIRKDENGDRLEIPVKLGDILSGKQADVTLAANDVLFIPDSKGKFVAYRGFEAAVATVTSVIVWQSRF